jgi:protein-tyrosine phosphatase
MHLWKKETQFGKESRIKNKKILMVCLGNICRSPLAQGAMEFLAKKNSLKIFVDSAGTEAWHTDKSPDHRAQKVAIAKSWDIASQKARKITPKDFRYFDLILAMDRKNLQDLQAACSKDLKVTIKLLLDFSPDKGKEIPDPYFSGNFEYVSNLIEKACLGFIESYKSVL